MRALRGWLVVVPALVSAAGCAGMNEARYVYQDGEYGVVGIPENTNAWPHYYRDQAEALIAAHFPEGHEIVRAEEVPEGLRTTTTRGSSGAGVGAGAPSPLPLPVSVPLLSIGLASDRSQADSVRIKECRIIYRRAPGAPLSGPFSAMTTPTPAPYVDPNAAERRKAAGLEKPDEPKAGKKSPAPPGPAAEEKKGCDAEET